MLLKADAKIPFPRALVFEVYRDKLHELVPYFPNVRGIDVKSREENAGVVKLVNIWHGGGEIPAAARAFLSEAMLSWTDRATWLADGTGCDWEIETHAFTEAVSCKGKNHYIEDGPSSTRVEIRGDLTIDAKKIKGVPRLLAGTVARGVEEFLVSKIRPNLIEVSQGVAKYLESNRKA